MTMAIREPMCGDHHCIHFLVRRARVPASVGGRIVSVHLSASVYTDGLESEEAFAYDTKPSCKELCSELSEDLLITEETDMCCYIASGVHGVPSSDSAVTVCVLSSVDFIRSR